MEVLYHSTRSKGEPVTASRAILKGLSDDGGLFVPDHIPALDKSLKPIVEISDIDIKGQFLEGRSEQNFSKKFDETYINELDLGHYPSGLPSAITPENAWNPKYTNYEAVALPWVSADSGMAHNFADYDSTSKKYTWTADVQSLSWQPYLLHIVRKICDAVGYTYDFSEWENDMMLRTLLICNTLPDAWEVSGDARALPH